MVLRALLNTNESFAQFSNEKHDLSWFYGDKFFQALDANSQANSLKDTGLSMMEGGTGYLTLNFESGEMVMDMGFTAPNDEMAMAKGKALRTNPLPCTCRYYPIHRFCNRFTEDHCFR